uniref:Uncharacterized protein n=1 Tax=Nelumbo nucifera TaxID=4432 RepID=A0A822XSK8_NELNU|nr:TPA_asm: hypothetical protein HUJ06_023258 [Nelumbo nucifera]
MPSLTYRGPRSSIAVPDPRSFTGFKRKHDISLTHKSQIYYWNPKPTLSTVASSFYNGQLLLQQPHSSYGTNLKSGTNPDSKRTLSQVTISITPPCLGLSTIMVEIAVTRSDCRSYSRIGTRDGMRMP